MDEVKSNDPGEASARAPGAVGIDGHAMVRALADASETELFQVAHKIRETRLIPLWYCPFMFCGTPGEPEKPPGCGSAMGRCLVKWAEEITRAVNDQELWTRDPDAWLVQHDAGEITPASVVSWAELEQWARDRHGLGTGYEEPAARETKENQLYKNVRNDEPDPRHRRTLLRVIAALMKQARVEDLPGKTVAHAINATLDETARGMKADTIAAVIKAAREID